MSEQSAKERLQAAGLCPNCGNEVCTCSKKEVAETSKEAKRYERAREEKESREARVAWLTEKAHELFPGEAAEKLREEIQTSFEVPQRGDYHNEGMYMDTHLEQILTTIDQMFAGEFSAGVSADVRAVIEQAFGSDKQAREENKQTFERYALTHDIAKKDCMTVKYENGDELVVTWEEWQEMLPAALQDAADPEQLLAYCDEQGVRAISYRQDFEDGTSRAHGDVGAAQLEQSGVDVDPLVIAAIRFHEAGLQFAQKQGDTMVGRINTKLYEKLFSDLSEQEQVWVITASYTDVMGSFMEQDDGALASNLEGVEKMIASKHNYEVVQAVKAVLDELGVEAGKQENILGKLKASDEVLPAAENVIATIKRKELGMVSYDAEKLTTNLAEIADADLAPDVDAAEQAAVAAQRREQIVQMAGEDSGQKKIGKTFGRALGGNMRHVMQALGKSEEK